MIKKILSIMLVMISLISTLLPTKISAVTINQGDVINSKVAKIQTALSIAQNEYDSQTSRASERVIKYNVAFVCCTKIKKNGTIYTINKNDSDLKYKLFKATVADFERVVEYYANSALNSPVIDIVTDIVYVDDIIDIGSNSRVKASNISSYLTAYDPRCVLITGALEFGGGITDERVFNVNRNDGKYNYGSGYFDLASYDYNGGTLRSWGGTKNPYLLSAYFAIHEFIHMLQGYGDILNIKMPNPDSAYEQIQSNPPANSEKGLYPQYTKSQSNITTGEVGGELPEFYKQALSATVSYGELNNKKNIGMYTSFWELDLNLGSYYMQAPNSYNYFKSKTDNENVETALLGNSNMYVWKLRYCPSNQGIYILNSSNYLPLEIENGYVSNDCLRVFSLYTGTDKSAQTYKFIYNSEQNKYLIACLKQGYTNYYMSTTGFTTNSNMWRISQVSTDNGTYVIRNASNNQVLSREDSNNSIYTTTYNPDSNNQKWIIKNLPNGYFTIQSAANNDLYWDVCNFYDANNTNVGLFGKSDARAQNWIAKYDSNGTCYLLPYCSTTRAYTHNNLSGNYSALYDMGSKSNQLWILDKVDKGETIIDGEYYIKNNINGSYLCYSDTGYAITTTTTKNYLSTWTIKRVDGKYYTIQPKNRSLYYWDVYNAADNEGTAVNIYTATGYAKAQNWCFIKNTDGTYCIMPKLSLSKYVNYVTNFKLSSVMQNYTLEKIS